MTSLIHGGTCSRAILSLVGEDIDAGNGKGEGGEWAQLPDVDAIFLADPGGFLTPFLSPPPLLSFA